MSYRERLAAFAAKAHRTGVTTYPYGYKATLKRRKV